MRYSLILTALIPLFFGCSSKSITLISPTEKSNKKKIVAYVLSSEGNWGANFEKVNQITHINFAFANIKDGEVIEGSENDNKTLKKLNELKKINQDLKILISVGGWTWSKNFSDAVLTAETREKFANSAVAFMLRHKIDGIDLDWEYPGLPGDGNVHRPEDKENFTAILKMLREKLDNISTSKNKYLLTIATGASQDYLDHTNMREAHQYLDFVNIMAYDFSFGNRTSHHAGLKTSNFDKSEKPNNAQTAVEQHINAGIPIGKIVLGVPFYGRWKKGVDPKNNGLYQLAKGISGSYNYNAIVDSLKNDQNFKTYWDNSAKAPYVWRSTDSLFLSYENERSIKYKVDYVKMKQLGGLMFWQFDGDSNGALLNTIFVNLYQ